MSALGPRPQAPGPKPQSPTCFPWPSCLCAIFGQDQRLRAAGTGARRLRGGTFGLHGLGLLPQATFVFGGTTCIVSLLLLHCDCCPCGHFMVDLYAALRSQIGR